MAIKRVKVSVTLILIAALLTFITACGNSSSKTGTSSSSSQQPETSNAVTEVPKKEPIELTFSTLNSWAQAEGIKEAIALYEKASGNKVKMDVYPDGQYANVIKTKMSTNDAPDLVYINLGDDIFPIHSSNRLMALGRKQWWIM